MEILIWVVLGVIGWIFIGEFALSSIDQNLEITTRKRMYPKWIVIIMDILWPFITIRYLIVKLRRHG